MLSPIELEEVADGSLQTAKLRSKFAPTFWLQTGASEPSGDGPSTWGPPPPDRFAAAVKGKLVQTVLSLPLIPEVCFHVSCCNHAS